MATGERWLSIALRAAPILLFLWMVRPLFGVVALGALSALLVHPLERRLMRRSPRLGRAAPIVLTAGIVVLLVIPFVVIGARVITSSQALLAGGLEGMYKDVQRFTETHLAWIADRLHLPSDTIRASAATGVQRAATALAAIASGAAASVPDLLVDLFVFVVTLYYGLRDGGAFVARIARLSPFAAHDTRELFESIHKTVHGAILGQLATSAVQGALTLIALYACGVPWALLLGLLATLLSVVPLLGTTPVTVGATLYLLAVGRPWAALAMGISAVIIGVSDNVVRPWVQGASTRIHPLITFLSIFGGIAVMGAAGVFLGPVIAATAVWTINLYSDDKAPPKP